LSREIVGFVGFILWQDTTLTNYALTAARMGLTEMQARFVKYYVESGDVQGAALRAGYSEGRVGNQLLANLHVTSAVHAEVQRQLVGFDGPQSLKVLRKLRDDDKVNHKVRSDIAIKLMHLAGHVAPRTQGNVADKQLSEMTPDELRAYVERSQAEIDRAQGELAERATPVDSVDGDAQSDAKPLDFLD
jgi:phage terminase small subunit